MSARGQYTRDEMVAVLKHKFPIYENASLLELVRKYFENPFIKYGSSPPVRKTFRDLERLAANGLTHSQLEIDGTVFTKVEIPPNEYESEYADTNDFSTASLSVTPSYEHMSNSEEDFINNVEVNKIDIYEQIAIWRSLAEVSSEVAVMDGGSTEANTGRNHPVEQYELFGLTPYDVKFKAGDCLFDAIRVSRNLSCSAKELRMSAISRLQNDNDLQEMLQVVSNNEEDKLRLSNGDLVSFSNPSQYIEYMSQDRTWGTYLEVIALSRCLKRSIIILSRALACPQILELDDYEEHEPIFLERTGEHYRPMLVPEGRTAIEILQKIYAYVDEYSNKQHGSLTKPKNKPVIFSKSSSSFRSQQFADSFCDKHSRIDEAKSRAELQKYKANNKSNPNLCEAMERVVMKSLGYELDGQVEAGAANVELSWRETGAARELDKKSVTDELSTTLLAGMTNAESVPARRLDELYNQYLQIIGKEPQATPAFHGQGYRLGQ